MCKHRDGGEGEEEEEGEICTPQPSPLDRRINTMRGKSNKLNDMTEAKRSMSLMAEMIGMIVALGRKMTDANATTIYGQVSWERDFVGMWNYKIFFQSAVFVA